MPTTEEIAAAASALTTSIQTDRQTLRAWQDAAKEADDLDRFATQIEAAGRMRVGLGGDSVAVTAPAFVAAVVTRMRARAAAVRDAVVLPTPPPV